MENNAIVLQGAFGSDEKRVTNFNLKNKAEAMTLINALQNCEFKLNDCKDKVIEVTNYYITERESEAVNNEGVLTKVKNHVLILFDKEGHSYVTGSNACYRSFAEIIAILGAPSKEAPLKLKPIGVANPKASGQYLKLVLC